MTRQSACFRTTVLALGLALAGGAAGLHAQWPQFRGPNGSGLDSSAGYPVEFSPSKNVVWKAAVPYAQSSPVIAGGRVYVTAGEGDRLVTIALDARNGRELWRRDVKRAHTSELYKANDPASPTPAADDTGVVSFFQDFGLVAYSPDGQTRWTHALGPFNNFYGLSSSSIIADGMVILVCDQDTGSFILALDRATGRVRWKTDRKMAASAWATPFVFRPRSGPPAVVVLGSSRLDAYDLTGQLRWWLPVGANPMGTALSDGESIFISTLGSAEPWLETYVSALAKFDKNKDGRLTADEFRENKEMGEHFGFIDITNDNVVEETEWNTARQLGIGEFGAMAVRPGSSRGQLPVGAIRWRMVKNVPYIPAPLLYDGTVYVVKDGGVVTSINPATGAVLKVGRSGDALGEYHASPVAADGKIFLASREGKVTVLRAGDQWDSLRVNDVGEEINATPALGGGRIYVRTRTTLYCFGG